MEIFKIGFISVRLLDVADILLVAFALYKFYKIFRRSVVLQLLIVVLVMFILWRVVELMDMVLVKSVLDEVLKVGTIGLIVLFAPEIRRFLLVLSHNAVIERFRQQLTANIGNPSMYADIISAAEELASSRSGAIIVLVGANDLGHIEQTGDTINATVQKRLLLSIFNKTSPLHDGAVLIRNNQIVAARCVLPVSDDPDIPPELGLRHRAALGITEISDAAAIIVSEETGKISVAEAGRIKRNLSGEELLQFITKFYGS